MKLLSLTICCFILRVKSQLTFQQTNYPQYYLNPLSVNTEQIYFEDQLLQKQQNSDLNKQKVTSFNGNVNNRQSVEQQAFQVQQNVQQISTPAAPSVNPANFNLWNQEPANIGQATVNQNAAVSNSNPLATNQNQQTTNFNQATSEPNNIASNQNFATINQNSFSSQNENIPLDNLDLSVLEEKAGQLPETQEPGLTQPPITQEIQGIFGQSQDVGTLNPVKPKIDSIGSAVTNFGLNLMKTFGDLYVGNTVISPYSISTCLALLQQGSRGTTEAQISNALQMRPDVSKAVFKAIGDDIKKRGAPNILRSANNIYMAKNFEFNANFSSIAQSEFNSKVSTLDYSVPAVAAREINNWVQSQTNGKIRELVRPSDVDITTQMTLVNAVYFKGLWDISFNEAKTKPRDFHLSNGQKKVVQFMRSRRSLRGGIEPATKAKIMTVPFKNDEYSLMWILPSKESNIDDYIKSLTAEQLLEFRDFPSQECDFEVPRFTIRADINLIPTLRKMGLSEMFGPFADLSGIGSNRIYSAPLQVSSAVHSAVLSINEQGGSAAAATSFGVVALSYDMPLKFKADRPFLVVLWDHASAVPLFMAKIMEPIEDQL